MTKSYNNNKLTVVSVEVGLICSGFRDSAEYLFYSFRVMTFLKPEDLVPLGYARYVNAFESLVGPLLIGFFALALRQRLKR